MELPLPAPPTRSHPSVGGDLTEPDGVLAFLVGGATLLASCCAAPSSCSQLLSFRNKRLQMICTSNSFEFPVRSFTWNTVRSEKPHRPREPRWLLTLRRKAPRVDVFLTCLDVAQLRPHTALSPSGQDVLLRRCWSCSHVLWSKTSTVGVILLRHLQVIPAACSSTPAPVPVI